jgi:transposase
VATSSSSPQVHPSTVADRYRSGQTVETIAVDIGVSSSVVRRILRSEGISTRTSTQTAALRLAPLREQIVTSYQQGHTLTEVARLVDRSITYVRTVLVEQGVPRRASGGKPKPRSTSRERPDCVAEIKARYERGESINTISVHLDVPDTFVKQTLRDAGVTMRTAREVSQMKRALLAAQIVDGYRNGQSIATVAKTVGRSRGFVRDVLIQEQIARRPPGNATPAPRRRSGDRSRAEEIATRYQRGETIQAIAGDLERSCHFVSSVLQEQQIPRRPRGRRPAQPSR